MLATFNVSEKDRYDYSELLANNGSYEYMNIMGKSIKMFSTLGRSFDQMLIAPIDICNTKVSSRDDRYFAAFACRLIVKDESIFGLHIKMIRYVKDSSITYDDKCMIMLNFRC